ncbi:MAG: transporterpermease protein [Chloroflexi bacterium]|nr:transporterpermease protein [Chloroflexota bacterium]
MQTARVTERSGARNTGLVARRELLIRLRSRAYVLSTLLLVGVAVVVSAVPFVVRLVEREAVTRVAVITADATLATIARDSLDLVLNGAGRLDPTVTRPFEVVVASDETAARGDVADGRLSGALVVTRGSDRVLSFTYLTNSPQGRTAILVRLGTVAIAVGDMVGQAQGLIGDFRVEVVDPAAADRPGETQQTSAQVLVYLLVILLFFVSIGYGMWVAASVVEEKSSRVIELVLGAATPAQLLAGKVAGVGLAGLVQLCAIVVPLLAVLLLQDQLGALILGDGPGIGQMLGGFGPNVLAAFVVMGVLGFLLSAFLYAVAGALVSRQEDVQQVALPMIVLTMAGYVAAALAVTAPEAWWVAPLSLLPFFSPYLMLVRLMLTTVAPWEIVVAVALMIVSIVAAARLAARVYAAGVLLYGQRASLRQLALATRSRR